jgi:hypothetical protein
MVKIIVIRGVSPYNLIDCNQPEDADSRFFRNVSNDLPDYA